MIEPDYRLSQVRSLSYVVIWEMSLLLRMLEKGRLLLLCVRLRHTARRAPHCPLTIYGYRPAQPPTSSPRLILPPSPAHKGLFFCRNQAPEYARGQLAARAGRKTRGRREMFSLQHCQLQQTRALRQALWIQITDQETRRAELWGPHVLKWQRIHCMQCFAVILDHQESMLQTNYVS
jgi:hypothetical protein